MKKKLFFATVLLLILGLTGCSKKDTEQSRPIWYTSVKLDSASAAVLREYAEQNIPWPEDSFYYSCEHMTTAHKNDNRQDLFDYCTAHEGETVEMTATLVGHSDKAFAVKLETNLQVASGVPHVTLAVNLTNGGQAYQSKDITDWEALPNPIPLKGRIVVNYETEESKDR